MSRSVIFLVVIPIAILLLSACGPSARGPIRLSEKDAGRTVELHTGDTLKVTMVEKPSTGYRWEVASGDTAILKQVGGREFRYHIISELISIIGVVGGDSGEATFHFEASASGQTVLKLVLQRPRNIRPVQTFEVTVVVK